MKTNAYEIILRPIFTEKSLAQTENNVYMFEVAKSANKTHIKHAIEELYDVKVKNVNVLNTKPRPRTVGRYKGYKRTYKKAIITLSEGNTIGVFEE